MTMVVTPSQLKPLLVDVLTAKLVPYIAGSPGIGKSDIVRQIAKDFNAEVIDFRLAQCDPTDLLGFPKFNEDKTRSGYAPTELIPLVGDSVPSDKSGWILFFDELPSAPEAVQAACYKILLDRMVGSQLIHEKVLMISAGNLDTDNAIVNEMGTAMQSRLIHFELSVSLDEWLEWASSNGVDYRILAFLQFKPDYLHKFDPDHDEHTFACPRTWEFVSKIIKPMQQIDNSKLPVLSGTISESVAVEFKAFIDVMMSLPDIKQIETSPETAPISFEPSTLYAITGILTHHLTEDNASPLMTFIKRLPLEFQTITLSNCVKKDRNLFKVPEIREWSMANGDIFII